MLRPKYYAFVFYKLCYFCLFYVPALIGDECASLENHYSNSYEILYVYKQTYFCCGFTAGKYRGAIWVRRPIKKHLPANPSCCRLSAFYYYTLFIRIKRPIYVSIWWRSLWHFYDYQAVLWLDLMSNYVWAFPGTLRVRPWIPFPTHFFLFRRNIRVLIAVKM